MPSMFSASKSSPRSDSTRFLCHTTKPDLIEAKKQLLPDKIQASSHSSFTFFVPFEITFTTWRFFPPSAAETRSSGDPISPLLYTRHVPLISVGIIQKKFSFNGAIVQVERRRRRFVIWETEGVFGGRGRTRNVGGGFTAR